MPNQVLYLLLFLSFLGGGLFVFAPLLAESLLFQPSRGDPGSPPELGGVAGELITVEASDGVAIQAWWYQLPGSAAAEVEGGLLSVSTSAPAVLFLHGNAGDISHRTALAMGLLSSGLSVLLLEYRGYGGSGGSPSEEGLHLDAVAGHEYLSRRLGSPERVVVFGRSMGGAVAARLAAERTVGALIVEASFTSLEAMARSLYPFLPGFLFNRLRGRFDTLSRLSEVTAPILIVHGSEDEIVPLEMGKALAEAAGPAGEWLEVDGAGHNDVFWVGGREYFGRLAGFVRERVGGEPRKKDSPH